MRPPICEYCGKRFDVSDGGTVRFANYEPLPDGMVGHPKGLGWFCGEHLTLAQSLRDQSLSDALKIMRDRM